MSDMAHYWLLYINKVALNINIYNAQFRAVPISLNICQSYLN